MTLNAAGLVVTFVLAILAAPLASNAQQAGKVPQIGYLSLPRANSPRAQQLLGVFQQGLRDHGWVEGQNIAIEWRFADGRSGRKRADVCCG